MTCSLLSPLSPQHHQALINTSNHCVTPYRAYDWLSLLVPIYVCGTVTDVEDSNMCTAASWRAGSVDLGTACSVPLYSVSRGRHSSLTSVLDSGSQVTD